MKQHHVFSTRDMRHANEVVALTRESGVPDRDISLVARADIELGEVPNERKEADTDFMPAALRGAGYGALAGIVIGLIGLMLVPLGGLGIALMAAVGAVVGAWASALMGSALPDPIRRKFQDQIEAGRVLVVVDADEDTQKMLEQRLGERGAIHLDHHSAAAMR
ncbi:DUF1269 domain-containing protein [Marilutibacter maris]|uniref:DUF1269 domain-containing protein n=1 Tax=Marilutibacter maris TaxID=1605891 RepID=A0A2U9T799_9GAMM|nr:DUF1269 domain-containing protein [Lysobacter maris]AWV07107.1 hypothetical protein C9I47_1406 [Lysobacter maris]KAB8180054.1 DUF1269 domain-containing protein [Lysobacter maris]